MNNQSKSRGSIRNDGFVLFGKGCYKLVYTIDIRLCILKNHWTTLSLSFVIYIWCWNLSSAVTITFFLRFLTYNLYKGYCFPLKHHLKPYAEGKKCVNLKSDILPIFFQLIRNNPDQETTTRFQVGSSFSGEQTLGGAFTAMASWIEARSGLTWPRGFSL